MPSGKGKITIRDVAREAGVGIGTVSRVLGNSGNVNVQTRARVAEAIERLGFRPSHAARVLARGRTQTLGVLVPSFTKHYFLEILRGVESAASEADHSLIVYNVERPEQALTHLEFLARTRRIDALVVVSLSPSLIRQVYPDDDPFPIAAVDTALPRAFCIRVDHNKAMQLAVGHLAQLGHKRIALVDRHQDPVSLTIDPDRRQGYLLACQAAGISPPAGYYLLAEYSQEGGYEAARQLLAISDPPTALACASDLQAMGAVRAAQRQGLAVGSDVAVTGCHDVELARWVGLTTVRVPGVEMGATAVRVLLEVLSGGSPQGTHTFEPELVVRESSGGSS